MAGNELAMRLCSNEQLAASQTLWLGLRRMKPRFGARQWHAECSRPPGSAGRAPYACPHSITEDDLDDDCNAMVGNERAGG